MAPAREPFSISVALNPSINTLDNLIELPVRLCEKCRGKHRVATAVMLIPMAVLIVTGLGWGLLMDNSGAMWLGGIAGLAAMVVALPAQRQSFPIFLDKGPVRFRNKEYNDLFYSRNAAFMKGLNAARRETVKEPTGTLSSGMQSFLRGGFYMGLFAIVTGFGTPSVLIGGVALAVVCGGMLLARSPR